jgi:DNA polymerase-3 subunit epsilon
MNPKLAFVDLETTGSTNSVDRITEVGIVQVSADGVQEWSSLVRPERPIPPMIESLTGISNAMVADAPLFADLAKDIASRLDGHLFIAHNARFDQGFLTSEFKRVNIPFQPTVLCTVRLSRKLYPEHRRHNLDSLIERHALNVSERHRALGDARLLWQFWQIIHREFPAAHIQGMMDVLSNRVTWPEHLDPTLPDRLPDTHGVYVFYNDSGLPLYVGRADKLRDRVLAHFQPGKRASAKAQRLTGQTRRIEWTETGGAVGSMLEEAALIRRLAPTHNHRGRRSPDFTAPWPYAGAIGIREGHALHIVRNWHFVGTARHDDEVWALLDVRAEIFDDDVYRILRDKLPLLRIVPLP